MKAAVYIRTDSLKLCDGSVMEGRSTLEIALAALHHETSAYKHLKDLPFANLSIQVRPVTDGPIAQPKTLNQEASGA